MKMLIDTHADIARLYISNIAAYLQRNIEKSIKILESLDLVVILFHLLPLPIRESISSLIYDRYRVVELDEEINKL